MLTPEVTPSSTNTKVLSLSTHVSGLMKKEAPRTTQPRKT